MNKSHLLHLLFQQLETVLNLASALDDDDIYRLVFEWQTEVNYLIVLQETGLPIPEFVNPAAA